MIQRIQTVYMLIVSIISGIAFFIALEIGYLYYFFLQVAYYP